MVPSSSTPRLPSLQQPEGCTFLSVTFFHHTTHWLRVSFHQLSVYHPSSINSNSNSNSTATMLRRAPTSISLSNRDVREHLENIDRKKRQDRESVQPKQGHRVPSAQPACELTDSLAKQLEKNAQNEVTVYEYGKVNQQRALRGGAPPFVFPRELAEEGSREESPFSDLDPDRLQLGGLLTIDQCTDSETEDNIDPVDPANFLGHLGGPPVIRHEDSSRQSSQTPRNTFDYGGFVEVNADQSSSFGKLMAKLETFSSSPNLHTHPP